MLLVQLAKVKLLEELTSGFVQLNAKMNITEMLEYNLSHAFKICKND